MQKIPEQQNWLINEQYSQILSIKINEWDELVADRLSPLQRAKLSSFYFDKNTHKIDLEALRESYQAFLVYYESLLQERDTVLNNFIEALSNYGLNINAIE